MNINNNKHQKNHSIPKKFKNVGRMKNCSKNDLVEKILSIHTNISLSINLKF